MECHSTVIIVSASCAGCAIFFRVFVWSFGLFYSLCFAPCQVNKERGDDKMISGFQCDFQGHWSVGFGGFKLAQ